MAGCYQKADDESLAWGAYGGIVSRELPRWKSSFVRDGSMVQVSYRRAAIIDPSRGESQPGPGEGLTTFCKEKIRDHGTVTKARLRRPI